MTRRAMVNAISLSRIACGLLFVVCFQRAQELLVAAFVAFIISLGTDVADGFLARRWHIASVDGRLWDSLGDKSFYAAAIIAFNAQGLLGSAVTWGLVVREVALYITRILYIDALPLIEQIRPLTNWHGYFMYVLILLGLGQMYAELQGISFNGYLYMQCAAVASLAFGIASIGRFIRLR